MTAERDHIAEAYFAITALLQSKIISPPTRHRVKVLREILEEEIATEINKSRHGAAS